MAGPAGKRVSFRNGRKCTAAGRERPYPTGMPRRRGLLSTLTKKLNCGLGISSKLLVCEATPDAVTWEGVSESDLRSRTSTQCILVAIGCLRQVRPIEQVALRHRVRVLDMRATGKPARSGSTAAVEGARPI